MTRVRLEAQALSIGYHNRHRRPPIASGLNLSLRAGELTCLVGPNGVGKSTLLRTLGGLQRALAGSIRIDGVAINEMDCARLARCIGVVLTNPSQPGDLRVEQVVGLGRLPYTDWLGNLTTQDRRVVLDALNQMKAVELAGRSFSQLSDGERQKVMVARALAQEPAVLLLDEPTAFLDWTNRVNLMTRLKTIAKETDKALLVSSHDLELVTKIADCLWIMDVKGQVITGGCQDLIAGGELQSVFPNFSLKY